MPLLGPRRKRNILHGATLHVWGADDTATAAGASSASAAAASSAAASSSASSSAAASSASSSGVAERIGARRRGGLDTRAPLPVRLGHFNVDVYLTLKLPIPRWLIPNRLIAWVLPRFVRAVWPTLIDVCFHFDASPFAPRVAADADGFYAGVAHRVQHEPADPLRLTPKRSSKDLARMASGESSPSSPRQNS